MAVLLGSLSFAIWAFVLVILFPPHNNPGTCRINPVRNVLFAMGIVDVIIVVLTPITFTSRHHGSLYKNIASEKFTKNFGHTLKAIEAIFGGVYLAMLIYQSVVIYQDREICYGVNPSFWHNLQ